MNLVYPDHAVEPSSFESTDLKVQVIPLNGENLSRKKAFYSFLTPTKIIK